jgi:predicted RNA-binding Zn-ribbon protein involved in translation (DUF1610 family)
MEVVTPAESNMAEKRKCPNCGCVEISRSHRNGLLEKYLFGAVGVHPYRCLNCSVRFYAYARFDEDTSVNNTAA